MIAFIFSFVSQNPVNYEVERRQAIATCQNWEFSAGGRNSETYRNTRDRSSLDVRAYQCRRPDLDKSWEIHCTSSRFIKGPNVPFSDIPLGTHTERYESAGTVRLNVRNGDTFSTIMVRRRGSGPKGNVTWHAADRDGDRIDAEGIARRLIALVEGRWSTEAGDSTFNGVRLPLRRGRGGQTFVDLTRWAHANSVSVNWNRRLGTASFTFDGRPFVVALGARSIKVGGTWRDIGDTIMMRDDDWYVPTRELSGG